MQVLVQLHGPINAHCLLMQDANLAHEVCHFSLISALKCCFRGLVMKFVTCGKLVALVIKICRYQAAWCLHIGVYLYSVVILPTLYKLWQWRMPWSQIVPQPHWLHQQVHIVWCHGRGHSCAAIFISVWQYIIDCSHAKVFQRHDLKIGYFTCDLVTSV